MASFKEIGWEEIGESCFSMVNKNEVTKAKVKNQRASEKI